MASIIKLKRSTTPSSIPSLLQEGELAVNLSDRKLFIGGENGGANVVTISGDQYNLATSGIGNTATVSLTVDNELLSNDSISFVGGAGITVAESSGVITITNDGTVGGSGGGDASLTVNGTENEIAVSRVDDTVTIALPSDVTVANDLSVTRNATVSGDLQVDGNLTIEGETTYISSSTVQVDDTMVKLSANNVGDTVDHGVYAKYLQDGTEKFAGYFRDSSDGSVFKFYKDLEVEPTTTVNIAGAGYTLAQIEAIIDGGTY
jgi:hypothetical protein